MRGKRSSFKNRVLSVLLAAGIVCSLGLAPAGTPHVHTEACFLLSPEQKVQTCGVRDSAHTHDAVCYDASGDLVCELEELEEHVHGEDCYGQVLVCGREEHTHDGNCGLEEDPPVCDKEEHVHSDECWQSGLICSLPETEERHQHSEGCFEIIPAQYSEEPLCGFSEESGPEDGEDPPEPGSGEDSVPEDPDGENASPPAEPEAEEPPEDGNAAAPEGNGTPAPEDGSMSGSGEEPGDDGMSDPEGKPENGGTSAPEDGSLPGSGEKPGDGGTAAPEEDDASGSGETPGGDIPPAPGEEPDGGSAAEPEAPPEDEQTAAPEDPPAAEDDPASPEDGTFVFEIRDGMHVLWTISGVPEHDPQGEQPDFEGSPAADSSPRLNDFLEGIDVLDEEGNPVTEENLKSGERYDFKLRFKELPEQEKIFRPATEEELRALGLTDEEIEGGPWMYVELGEDVSAEGGTASSDDNLRVSKDGKYLLVKYEGDESQQMDSVEVDFFATLEKGTDPEGFHVLEGETGTWKPQPAQDPYVQKKGVYNPGTHCIDYEIQICNPGTEELSSVTLNDAFTDSETGKMPSLVQGSVKLGSEPLPDSSVSADPGQLHFKDIGPVPAGTCTVLTYSLDVSEQMKDLENSSTFWVDNTVVMSVQGHEDDTDSSRTDVYRPSLDKIGYGNGEFWGADPTIRWNIDAYDPYSSLADTVFTEHLPPGITFADIVGVLFRESVDGNMQDLQVYVNTEKKHTFDELLKFMHQGANENEVIFDFRSMPQELKDKIFKNGGHRLYLSVITEAPGPGVYENTVTAALPSDGGVERSADFAAVLTFDGVSVQKSGHLAEDGKQMEYEIQMRVGPNIPDGGSEYGIGAGLIDLVSVTPEAGRVGRLDIDEGLTIESVTAKYDGGTWEFTKDGDSGHEFAVRSVATFGTADDGALSDNEKRGFKDRGNYFTAIILNPQYEEKYTLPNGTSVPWRVWGKWPEELASKDVTVTFKYRLDPGKAYFVNSGKNTREPFEDCSTLADYLKKKGDIVLDNYATGAVKGAVSSRGYSHNLVVPVSKKATDHVDLVDGEKYVTYEVSFRNGRENDGAVPHSAENIVFHDVFDSRMEYVSGSLVVKAAAVDGTAETFQYGGVISGNEITIPWKELLSVSSGKTLEEVFHEQTSDWNCTFTYELRPGPGMPSDQSKVEITNNSWMTFGTGPCETDHGQAAIDFPTGVLTKRSALEEGKVAFYVEINEQSQDLDPESETLTVRDAPENLKYLRYVQGSLKVEVFRGGSWTELTEGVTETVKEDGSFELTVPDETHLRLHYSYELTEDSAGKTDVEITNTVQIGNSGPSDGDTWTFTETEIHSSHTESHNTKFTLKKVRSGDDVPVSGAKFVLYAHNLAGLVDEAVQQEVRDSGLPEEYSYGGRAYFPAAVFETGGDGTCVITWTLLKTNVTYLLAEASVPEGYERLEGMIAVKVGEDEKITFLDGGGDLVHAGENGLIVENTYGAINLPMTGGAGAGAWAAAGAVLYAALAAAAAATRRKKTGAQESCRK